MNRNLRRKINRFNQSDINRLAHSLGYIKYLLCIRKMQEVFDCLQKNNINLENDTELFVIVPLVYINPIMYTDETTSIWGDALRNVGGIFASGREALVDIGRFVGGLAIAEIGAIATILTASLLLIPGISVAPQFFANITVYGGTLMTSPFSNEIKSDMQLIGWNPFNSNANAAVQSQKISFYKGASVFRHNGSGSMGLLGMIFLHRNSNGLHPDWLRHEYGHMVQGRVLVFLLFAVIVGIPSLVGSYQYNKGKITWDEYKNFILKDGQRGAYEEQKVNMSFGNCACECFCICGMWRG